MERNDEIKKYLKCKHKGGMSNQKGGLYEDLYAVFQIVSCIAKYKFQYDNIQFQTQLEDTFVDDLLVALPSENIYHQLKNAKSVKWGNPDTKGNIAFDFVHQIEDCLNRGESFALKLVHSAISSNIANEIPGRIKPYSSVEYFEYADELNKLVLLSADIKSVLQEISPLGQQTPADKLADIAVGILGVWKSCDSKRKIRLSELISKVERLENINLSIWPDAVMGEECKNVLMQIDGLIFSFKGKMLYWEVGLMKGEALWSPELEEKIISRCPKSKMEFITLLP